MKRKTMTRLAAAASTAALAFGAVACQVEDDGMSPGQEDPMMDDGMGGDGMGGDGFDDGMDDGMGGEGMDDGMGGEGDF